MARPGLTKHRKFRRLARLLGSDVVALGHLEWLWSVAYEDGNDYLRDSDDVESAAKWTGEPGGLTAALLTCGGHGHAGFIEPAPDHPAGHYRIHELWDHAPRYVKRRAAREQERKDTGRPMDARRSPTGRPVDVTPSTRTQHPADSTNGGLLTFTFTSSGTSSSVSNGQDFTFGGAMVFGLIRVSENQWYILLDDSGGNPNDKDFDDLGLLVTFTPRSVPEPGTLGLLGLGLLGMVPALRRRRLSRR